MNRRSFFGLFGGAAVVPFVKFAPSFAQSVESALPQAAKVISTANNPRLLWPGVSHINRIVYGNDFGTVEVIERAKSRLARARLDAVYAKTYGDDA